MVARLPALAGRCSRWFRWRGHRRPGTDGSEPTCPDVQLIFARGTAEPPGLGVVGDALFAALQPALGSRNFDAYAVNYPASYNFLQTGDGANDARDHIAAMADQCPATRLILGGFSQGAAAVSMLAGVPPLGSTVGNFGSAPALDPGLAGKICGGRGVRQSRQPLQHAPVVGGCSSPAVPSTCAAPVIRSASSAAGTATRTTTIGAALPRPGGGIHRRTGVAVAGGPPRQSVRYCENAHSHRLGQRRGSGAASWRRSCRVVPCHPRRARAGLRRASQLRQGAGAGGRARFRDHRARRRSGHRLSRRLRQRAAGRRGVRRVRRAARDRACLRPQHHRRVGGRAPRWRWPRWPTTWA